MNCLSVLVLNKVKTYTAPITMFDSMKLDLLEVSPSDFIKVTSIHQNGYFFAETISAPGSSGGAVANLAGKFVGMVVYGWVPDVSVTQMMMERSRIGVVVSARLKWLT